MNAVVAQESTLYGVGTSKVFLPTYFSCSLVTVGYVGD